jgi:endonuclease/exonuclease/phosphatase family metal-dependent hydrolase
MSDFKLVLWNMEWMNDLFQSDQQAPSFRPDDAEPLHHKGATVRQRRDDLSGVLNELAPDIVVIVEGPSRPGELQLFFDGDVQGEWKTALQISRGQSQNIGIALRVDQGKFADSPIEAFDTNQLQQFDSFLIDTDEDEVSEQYKFERRPLYVEISPAQGRKFRLLGLHLKSKGIFGAYEWSRWWSIADANRRKIIAQCSQIRQRFLDPYLSGADTGAIPLLVCGDINDGPGMDASEKRLFGSGIERLMGTIWKPELCLRSALFDSLSQRDKADLDFSSIATASYKDPIFNSTWHWEWIDHILYTKQSGPPWVDAALVNLKMADGKRIWEKYKHASDHFPISAMIHTNFS